ncbi:MAG TPA: CPBP family intramembrane glutamic endopeptidase [Chitinophagaceae bacterium]|jgi:membrane protease YdiL (CAAX protease family)|nr:CPBP family intramembrane glutamic endopeptidase [Chitinophagaceae bacterium]
MNKSIFRSQVVKIIFLFIIFVLTAFILGGFILNGLLRIPSQIANVIVIIAILFITWQAYKKEGKNLSELGVNLRLRNIGFGMLGLLIGGIFIIPLVYTIAFIKGYPVVFNQNFNGYYVLTRLWLLLPTVILEELAFRGVCFKKTVEISSVKTANIIFATLFILSHWINLGAFGNPVQMTILLITGLGHILYATAFLKSKTLYFPIGIHLGNNWVTYFVFSNVDINDATKGQVNPSLINIISNEKNPVFNGQFILTTIVTAIFFVLFILAIGKWTASKQLTLN